MDLTFAKLLFDRFKQVPILEKKNSNTILNEKVLDCVMIDDSKSERVIEKVQLNSKTVVLKYGSDEGLKNEVNIYKRMGQHKKIPHIIIADKIKENYVLVLDWVHGKHPDFSKSNDVTEVFANLGGWAAEWSTKINELVGIQYDLLDAFERLGQITVENRTILVNTVGVNTYEYLKQVLSNQDYIILNLKKIPLTLNPGDISLHNCLIRNKDDSVILIDFESASIRPMITFLEHFSERYESLPTIQEQVTLAEQAFFNSWNKHSYNKISWSDFKHSQVCSMIYYKISNHLYWVQRILRKRRIEETIQWIQRDERSLKNLISQL